MFKLYLGKAEEPEIKLPTSVAAATAKSLQLCLTLCDPIEGSPSGSPIPGILCWIKKAREFPKNIYFCFIDYAKPFDCVDHSKLENSSRVGNTRPPDLSLEKSVCRSGSKS